MGGWPWPSALLRKKDAAQAENFSPSIKNLCTVAARSGEGAARPRNVAPPGQEHVAAVTLNVTPLRAA
jgi:hypothetical protein